MSNNVILKLRQPGRGVAGLHACRHAKASTLLNRGPRMEEVSAILGHRDPSTTARIYAQYNTRHLRHVFDERSVPLGGGQRCQIGGWKVSEGPGSLPGPCSCYRRR